MEHSPAEHGERIPHRISYDVAMALAILALGAFLSCIGLSARWSKATSAAAITRSADLTVDVLVGDMALWAGVSVVCWWALSMTAAFANATLLVIGRTGPAIQLSRFSPAFMQRLALAMLGLNLAVLPAAQASGDPGTAGVVQSTVTPDLAKPFFLPDGDARVGAAAPGRTALHGTAPNGTAPSETAEPGAQNGKPHDERSPGSLLDPSWTPGRSVTPPGPLVQPAHRNPSGTPVAASEAEVRPGDSLWSIVKRHLGPQASDLDIALAWPRWYEHNRERIGSDPDLILPGTVLSIPPEAMR